MAVIIIEVALSPENAAAKAAELAVSIQKIKDQQTILNATNQKASQEYANNTAKLKTLTQEQKAYNTIAKEATGSNNQLRAQLTLLTNQYNAMGKAERDTTTAGKALLTQTRAISDELKRNEKAVGDNRRNVGNYTDAIKDAAFNMLPFGSELGRAGHALGSLTGVIKANVVGLNLFKIALVSTGIGAIVVLLGSLIAYFKSTEKGSEMLERGIAGLKGAFSAFIAPLAKVGEFLVDLFTNPIKALKDFKTLLSGNLLTGIKNFGKSVSESVSGSINAKKLEQDAEDAGRELNKQASKLRADAAVLRAKGDAASLKQAEQFLKKADALTQQSVSNEIKAQDALIKNKEKLGQARDEDYDKLNELYAKQDQSRQTDAAKAEKINTRLEKLAEKEKAEQEKLAEAYKKKAEAQNKFFEDIQKDAISQLGNVKRFADAEVKEREELAKQIDVINKKNLEKFEKNAAQMEVLIAERLQSQVNLANAQLLANTEAERLSANQAFLDAKYQQDVDNAFRTGKDITLINATYARDTIAVNAERDRALTDSFDKFSSNFQSAVGQNSAAYKIAGAIQAKVDAAASLRNNVLIIQENLKALATQGKLLFPFNIIAIFSTLAALASAANSAKTIFSVPGFAGGGFVSDGKGSTVKGAGTSKSDSIPARLSTGESVINARSTEMFAPILSQINQAGGGRAFSVPGNGSFAAGGIAQGSYITGLSETSQQANQMNALMNTLKMLPPPIVDVRQIILESQKFAATQVRQNI